MSKRKRKESQIRYETSIPVESTHWQRLPSEYASRNLPDASLCVRPCGAARDSLQVLHAVKRMGIRLQIASAAAMGAICSIWNRRYLGAHANLSPMGAYVYTLAFINLIDIIFRVDCIGTDRQYRFGSYQEVQRAYRNLFFPWAL